MNRFNIWDSGSGASSADVALLQTKTQNQTAGDSFTVFNGTVSCSDPVAGQDVATKSYVDASQGNSVVALPTGSLGDILNTLDIAGNEYCHIVDIATGRLFVGSSTTLAACSYSSDGTVSLISTIALGLNFSYLTLEGNTIYAGRDSAGLSVIDVTNTAAMEIKTTMTDYTRYYESVVIGTDLWVGVNDSTTATLVRYDISNPHLPVFQNAYVDPFLDLNASINRLAYNPAAPTVLYCAAAGDKSALIDITMPSAPGTHSTFQGPNYRAQGIIASATRLYVCASQLRIYDISTPSAAPQLLDSFTPPTAPAGIGYAALPAGNFIFMSVGQFSTQRLYSFDVTADTLTNFTQRDYLGTDLIGPPIYIADGHFLLAPADDVGEVAVELGKIDVDESIYAANLYTPPAGITVAGGPITASVTPTLGTHLTNKTYVDAQVGDETLTKPNSTSITNTSGGTNITTGTGNTVYGVGALSSSTGSNNVAVGSLALDDATTANDTVGVGTFALGNLTSGNRNIAVGTAGGTTISTGSDNVCIGYNSGSFLSGSNGDNNILIGQYTESSNFDNCILLGGPASAQAANEFRISNTHTKFVCSGMDLGSATEKFKDLHLSGNTTQDGNITASGNINKTGGSYQVNGVSGKLALQTGDASNLISEGSGGSITSANTTTGYGQGVLGAITTQSRNNAFGNSAMSDYKGEFSIAIGWNAMNTSGASVSGISNISIGDGAMGSQTTGSNNVGIGGGNLYALTSGSNNVGVGSSAGATITTETDNVCVGHNSDAAGFSNSIALGSGAAATASNQMIVHNTTQLTSSGNNTCDLGASGTQFKDLYLGGNMNTGGYIELNDITAPANPAAGEGRLYKKTGDDGLFWKPDAAGPEVDLTAGGSSFNGGAITNPITAADGTVGAPSYSFTSMTNSGIYGVEDIIDEVIVSVSGQKSLTCNSAGQVVVEGSLGLVVNQNISCNGDTILTSPTVPASAGAAGTTGTISWDANYIYVCVATNTWKRVAIATW